MSALTLLRVMRQSILPRPSPATVSRTRMMGGWMMGTSDMYEYAAMATGAKRSGARIEAA